VFAGGAGFEDGEADVHGVALVAVAGDGPAELDVASRVAAGDGDGSPLRVRHDQPS
jgi:hypothetical protein